MNNQLQTRINELHSILAEYSSVDANVSPAHEELLACKKLLSLRQRFAVEEQAS